jgi:glutamate dehydrogenase (NAD(P)+)
VKDIDELGPEAQVFVSDPATGMRGVLVIDNTVLGPCGGGARMLPDLTADEVADLARGMSYKFSILGLPRGGSKAGIWGDPNMPAARKRELLMAFGRAIGPYLASKDVSVGPDMGITVRDVASIYEGARAENVRTGLFERTFEDDPAAYHITGYGVIAAVRAAATFAGLDLARSKVAIEGFGQVGAGAARYVAKTGAKVVGISTVEGALFNERGLDVQELLSLRRRHGDRCLAEYRDGERLSPAQLYALPVDVLVPGARPYVINEANAPTIQARLVVSGGNITVTAGAEELLFRRGVLSVPDFVANSGGAIASWVDMLGGDLPQAFLTSDALIGKLTTEILSRSAAAALSPYAVATARARERILAARGKPRKRFDEIREEIRAIFADLTAGRSSSPMISAA